LEVLSGCFFYGRCFARETLESIVIELSLIISHHQSRYMLDLLLLIFFEHLDLGIYPIHQLHLLPLQILAGLVFFVERGFVFFEIVAFRGYLLFNSHNLSL
jgi:hypothetical protein